MPSISRISLGSLSDEAFDKLLEAISEGEFRPGERLSEADLARRFGISRGPLREALGRLEGFLVERTPRIGVRVIELRDEDLKELFAVRIALESMACRLAASNATDEELEHLSDLLEEHSHDPATLNESGYFQKTSDNDFHFQIVRCARNRRLSEMLLEGVYYQLRLYRFKSSAKPGRARAAFTEHQKIVKALRARDPDAAEAAMRAHLTGAYESFQTVTATTAEAPKKPARKSRAKAVTA